MSDIPPPDRFAGEASATPEALLNTTSSFSPRQAFGALFLLAALTVFMPFLADVPVFREAPTVARIDGVDFFQREASYSFFFNPVRDFIRHYIATHHQLPLWCNNAMFGLPLVEQADFQLFNPLEWINWLGGRTWWAFLLCVYLAWAGLGIFLITRQLLFATTPVALATAAIYIISGSGMYAMTYFSMTMNILCLPFIIYHGTSLVVRGQGRRWHFLGLVAYLSLLLTSGQPQYLALGAAGLLLYFVVLFIAFPSRLPRLPFVALAPICALLLAAPQVMPFLQSHLTQSVYGGNHAFSMGPSYWRHGLITSMQLFAPHITGPVGRTWYQPRDLDTTVNLESFSIGFGLVAILLMGCGALHCVVGRWPRRFPPATLQRLFCGLGIVLLAYVMTENLIAPPRSIWPLPFIHLNKYAPPVLALFLVLGIPAGFKFLANCRFPSLLFILLPVLALPLFLAAYLGTHSPEINHPLLAYALTVSYAAPVALFSAWLCRGKLHSSGMLLLLSAAAVLDAGVVQLQGLPVRYDYWRIIAYLLIFSGVLAAAGRTPAPRRWLPVAAATLIYLIFLGLLASRIQRWPVIKDFHREIQNLGVRESGESGRARLLASTGLIYSPNNLDQDIKSLVSRFPIYPLATQGYYVRIFGPEILADRQRYHSFMVFSGVEDSRKNSQPTLSWKTYATERVFFDLLGVDLLIDREAGELDAFVQRAAIQGVKPVTSPELAQHNLRAFRSETSLHRAYFRQSYETLPFSEDGSFAQTLMQKRGERLRRTPLLEITYDAAPRWDGLTLPIKDSSEPPAIEAPAAIAGAEDYDGHVVYKITTPAAGLFVLNEQYHRGWKVRVNGTLQPVLRVNTIAQGVLIPDAGSYQLEFDFRGSLARDLLISLAGLGAVSMGLLAQSKQRCCRKPEAPPGNRFSALRQ